MSRTKPWELSDAMWERAQPLLPPQKPHPKGGRPPRADQQMLGAMLYVLRTGIQWNALPHEIGAATTVYDRFRAWEQDGFFERLWVAGLSEFEELVGIDWEWSGKAWMERCPKPLSPAPRPPQRKASATIRRIAANTASSAAP